MKSLLILHLDTNANLNDRDVVEVCWLNGMIFGSERGRLDHRISLVRSDVGHRPTMYDRN